MHTLYTAECCFNGAYATNTCCINLTSPLHIPLFPTREVNNTLPQTLLPASVISSSYHQYVEAIKQKLIEKEIGLDRIKLALRFMPCYQDSDHKQAVFSQSSPLLQAENSEEIFQSLTPYSSWFNHGFITQLAARLLEGSGTSLTEDFLASILEMESSPLSILPRLSTTSQCPAEFEKLLVKVERIPEAFTLNSVLDTSKNVSQLLGLRPYIVLLSSISAGPVRGSSMVFWIPQIASSSAISKASQNAHQMLPAGVLSITAKYEIITPAVKQVSIYTHT